MHKLLQHFIDFIFPPNQEEVALRKISPEELPALALRAGATEFPFIYAIFNYKDSLVRELIWQIKYKKNKHAVKCAGYAIYKWLQGKENALLVPVPISRKRRRERGYNQCELIIDEILRLDGRFKKDYDLLIRVGDIERQTLKNRNERIENTKNIFKIKRKAKQNEKIILIDDVTTTGSTLVEAREAMLRAGFTDIEVVAVAH